MVVKEKGSGSDGVLEQKEEGGMLGWWWWMSAEVHWPSCQSGGNTGEGYHWLKKEEEEEEENENGREREREKRDISITYMCV